MRQSSLSSFFAVNTKPTAELDEFGNPIEKKQKRVKQFAGQAKRGKVQLYDEEFSEDEVESRVAQLALLRQDILEDRPPLVDTLNERNKFVFDRGSPTASLMIIGEAPGYYESLDGRPFVGASGQLLNEYLDEVGISESQIYVTNLVKVRPPGNRDPTWEEIRAYLSYLQRQIEIVQPKIIMCLGRIASTVVYNGLRVGESLRGKESDKVPNQHELECVAMAKLYRNSQNSSALFLAERKSCYRTYFAYHPSAVLREDPDTFEYKNRWKQDFKNVAEILVRPRLAYIDAVEFLGGIEKDFAYRKPDDVFWERKQLLLPDKRAVLESAPDNKLDFETFKINYATYTNTYDLMGRTRCGKSALLRVHKPEFGFYAYSGRISRMSADEISVINEYLHSRAVAYAAEKSNMRDERVFCRVTPVQKKTFIHYQSHLKQHLRIAYSHSALQYELKEALERLVKEHKTFESFIPVQQLMLDRDVYSYGWLPLPTRDSSLRLNEGRHQTYCDLELNIDYSDLRGESPNAGESEDVYQEMAAMRVMSIDAEMLNTRGFPIAEQNPIVSICAYSQTYNHGDDPLTFEERAKPGAESTLQPTGRSNYDHAAVFTIGPVRDIDSKAFKADRLPMPPDMPAKKHLPRASRGHNPDGSYQRDYIIAIRTWNAYRKKLFEWREKVGVDRAKLYFQDARLYKYLFSLQERPDGQKSCWQKPLVAAWEKLVLRAYARRGKTVRGGMARLPEIDVASIPESKRRERIGSIQADWDRYHCRKNVFCFESEEEMLRGFYKYVHQYDPDLITGWNVCDFDLAYFIRRVQVLDIRDEHSGKLISMGRYRDREDYITTKRSSSRARGERVYKEIHLAGRDVLDMLHVFLSDAYGKFESYTLAFIAQYHLGDTKNDVPYEAIPSLFKNNPERLNDYCLKDAELVLMLMNYLNTMNFVTAFCRAIGMIEIGRLFMDGVQGKVLSCVLRFLRREGLDKIFPDKNIHSNGNQYCEQREAKGYQGAWVGEGVYGLVLKMLICLDYASLYPSIILAYNLSHDMCGWRAHMEKHGIDVDTQCTKTNKDYLNPKTGEWEPFYFLRPRKFFREQLEPAGYTVDDCYYDAQDPAVNPATGRKDGTYMLKTEQGAFAGTVRRMLDDRYATKKEMKKWNPWDPQYKVLDSIQLVKKLIANSSYGATGVEFGKLVLRALAEQVTTTGARHIQEMDQGMRQRYNAQNYGGDTDSIFEFFPQMTRPEHIYEEVEENGVVKPRIDHIVDFSNTLVPHPVRNEFEKIYEAYWGYGKKKKSLYLVNEPRFDNIEGRFVFDGRSKFGTKGTEVTRRDNCKIGRDILEGYGERMLRIAKEKGLEHAKAEAGAWAREQVDRVKRGEVEFHELIESRQLSKSVYKSQSIPHLTVVNKLKKRLERAEEGVSVKQVPQLGERVPYIVVTGRKGIKRYQAAEDPDYALEHGLQPDLGYIIEQRIRQPLKRFIDTFEDAEDILHDIFGEKQKFHINVLDDDELAPFLKPLHKCMSCGVGKQHSMLCSACLPQTDFAALERERAERRAQISADYERELVTCRACMAIGDHEEVVCSTATCEQYFPRKTGEYRLKNYDKETEELHSLHRDQMDLD